MEITNSTEQTVAAGQNVIFTDTPVAGSNCIIHRAGSGLVKLRGLTSQCRARFKVMFNGNLALPTGGTPASISVALTIDGEPVPATIMTITPAAVNEYSNVAAAMYVDVPKNCCSSIGVENVNSAAILVNNANLIVERVA